MLLALPSSGLHSNGFSLIGKILKEKNYSLSRKIYEKTSLGKLLIKPTKIYVKPILKALKNSININAMAHITGGGIIDNLKRVLSKNYGFIINKKKLAFTEKNNIYFWLKNDCKVSERELIKTFNCGIGMILVVPRMEKELVINYFRKNGQPIFHLGEITKENKALIA